MAAYRLVNQSSQFIGGPLKCPKCGGEMTEGFVPIENESLGGVATWIAGPPQAGFLGAVKISGKAAHKIRTFRCAQCGLLEFYAPAKT